MSTPLVSWNVHRLYRLLEQVLERYQQRSPNYRLAQPIARETIEKSLVSPDWSAELATCITDWNQTHFASRSEVAQALQERHKTLTTSLRLAITRALKLTSGNTTSLKVINRHEYWYLLNVTSGQVTQHYAQWPGLVFISQHAELFAAYRKGQDAQLARQAQVDDLREELNPLLAQYQLGQIVPRYGADLSLLLTLEQAQSLLMFIRMAGRPRTSIQIPEPISVGDTQ